MLTAERLPVFEDGLIPVKFQHDFDGRLVLCGWVREELLSDGNQGIGSVEGRAFPLRARPHGDVPVTHLTHKSERLANRSGLLGQ